MRGPSFAAHDFSSGTPTFQPSGTHRTLFTGTGSQTISFQGSGPAHNRFQELDLAPGVTLTLGSDFFVAGSLIKPAGAVATLSAGAQRLVRVGGLAVDGAVFDLVRLQLSSPSPSSHSICQAWPGTHSSSTPSRSTACRPPDATSS